MNGMDGWAIIRHPSVLPSAYRSQSGCAVRQWAEWVDSRNGSGSEQVDARSRRSRRANPAGPILRRAAAQQHSSGRQGWQKRRRQRTRMRWSRRQTRTWCWLWCRWRDRGHPSGSGRCRGWIAAPPPPWSARPKCHRPAVDAAAYLDHPPVLPFTHFPHGEQASARHDGGEGGQAAPEGRAYVYMPSGPVTLRAEKCWRYW